MLPQITVEPIEEGGGRGDGGGKEKLPERLVEVNSEEWEYT